jgi:hypothetical protein
VSVPGQVKDQTQGVNVEPLVDALRGLTDEEKHFVTWNFECKLKAEDGIS